MSASSSVEQPRAASLRIGLLSLQGAVEPHRPKLARLGVEPVAVRTAADLEACAGLIIPGGESTTFLHLIKAYGLKAPLLDFAARAPVWGICAGSILMAEQVEHPPQESLGLMPVTIERNAYGRQNESFIATFTLNLPGQSPAEQEGVFIRAPRVSALGAGVQVFGEQGGFPVVAQYGHHLLTTFHPELSASDLLHRHFLELCREVVETGWDESGKRSTA